jgi:hypothetical protein
MSSRSCRTPSERRWKPIPSKASPWRKGRASVPAGLGRDSEQHHLTEPRPMPADGEPGRRLRASEARRVPLERIESFGIGGCEQRDRHASCTRSQSGTRLTGPTKPASTASRELPIHHPWRLTLTWMGFRWRTFPILGALEDASRSKKSTCSKPMSAAISLPLCSWTAFRHIPNRQRLHWYPRTKFLASRSRIASSSSHCLSRNGSSPLSVVRFMPG